MAISENKKRAVKTYSKRVAAETVKKVILDPEIFPYLPFQTQEICMAAVMRDGTMLQYAQFQSHAIRLAAVRQTWKAMEFVSRLDYEFCYLAADSDQRSVTLISDPDLRKHVWHARYPDSKDMPDMNTPMDDYMRDVVPENFSQFNRKIIAETVKKVILEPEIFPYLPFQTPEVCMAAVMQDGMLLSYVKDQTPEICVAAVEKDWRAMTQIRTYNSLVIDLLRNSVLEDFERKCLDREIEAGKLHEAQEANRQATPEGPHA